MDNNKPNVCSDRSDGVSANSLGMQTRVDAIPYNIEPGNSGNTQNNIINPNGVNQGGINPGGVNPNDINQGGINPGGVNLGVLKLEPYYKMSGKKYMVIFNYTDYECFSDERVGTNADVATLENLFGNQLGFHVDVKNNRTYEQVFGILIELIRKAPDAACLCVVFLTHGSVDGGLWATDKMFPFKEVLDLFEIHTAHVNIPKLFFIQACRGRIKDKGILKHDGDDDAIDQMVIPTHADFLVVRACVENHACFRNADGSWLIQDLCQVIQQYHLQLDLVQMLSLTHQKVALRKSHENKKQVPETLFTLTKLLKLS